MPSESAARKRDWWPSGFGVVLVTWATGSVIGTLIGLAWRGAL